MQVFNEVNLIFLLIFLSACSFEKFENLSPSNTSFLTISEKELGNKSHVKRINTFFETSNFQYFLGVNETKITYKVFINPNEIGVITILNGRTESIPKYKELIFDLYNNGYSIYIHDHRGQGMSERIYKENSEIGHVENFQFYIDDLKKFYNYVISPNKHDKLFILGHSMGGTIATLYIEQYPNDFDAIALTSPMFGLNFPSCEFIDIIKGDEISYAPGQTDYTEAMVSFAQNELTNSKLRFNRIINAEKDNSKIRLGGPSTHWVSFACEAMEQLHDELDKIKIPLLLLQASNETIVNPSSHRDMIDKMISSKKTVESYTVDGAKHELLFEIDDIRTRVISKILEFFQKF